MDAPVVFFASREVAAIIVATVLFKSVSFSPSFRKLATASRYRYQNRDRLAPHFSRCLGKASSSSFHPAWSEFTPDFANSVNSTPKARGETAATG